MNILEKLPALYKFTEADVDRGVKILARYFENKPVTDEELELEVYTSKAWDMYCDTRKWPTVTEVAQQLQREAEEAERRYVNTFTAEAQRKYWEEKKRKAEA